MTDLKTRYTFGHSNTAAVRLKLIADFFNRYSSDFITAHTINHKIQTSIDLGCGIGHTTKMLQQASRSIKTYGFDISEDFINQASVNYPELQFIIQDVTDKMFPVHADLLYSRFLLTHLKHIDIIIANWINQLKLAGYLFLDELEDITTNIEVFRKYLEINTNLVKSQGGEMFVGQFLDEKVKNMNVVFRESCIIPVEIKMAASWFYPNTISIWKTEQKVLTSTTSDEREKISKELLYLQNGKKAEGFITWKMKRIIIQKAK